LTPEVINKFTKFELTPVSLASNRCNQRRNNENEIEDAIDTKRVDKEDAIGTNKVECQIEDAIGTKRIEKEDAIGTSKAKEKLFNAADRVTTIHVIGTEEINREATIGTSETQEKNKEKEDKRTKKKQIR
jgi:hypothetical protein